MEVLGFFPTPYFDELFYSVLARYHLYSGNESYKKTTFELFDTYNAVAVIDLTGSIMKIVQKLPTNSELTAEIIVKNHTLFPFYAHFVPKERAEMVREHMINSGTGGIHSTLGLVASNIKMPSHLRYCPECTSEDIQKHGETYWRRIHQLPGIMACHKHNQTLMNSTVQLSFLSKREYVVANVQNCLGSLSPNLMETDLLHMRDLAKLANSILQGDYKAKQNDFFRERYIDFLQEADYVTEGGRVHKDKLNNGVKEYYGESLLALAQSSLDSENWLVEMIRKSKSSKHPLRHLLFINYLGKTLDEIMSDKQAYLPFGEGPWPCLNIAADHYREKTIKSATVSRCIRKKKTLGSFSCICGYEYQRYGPDRLTSDIYRADKVITCGEAWERRLEELANINLSLYEIAGELNVLPYTVQKFAHRLNLSVTWTTYDLQRERMDFSEKQMKYRELCVKYMERFPSFRRSDLKLYCRAYNWLRNHDSEWLDDLLPAEQPIYINTSDWIQRDEDLLEKIQYLVEMIFEEEGKPVRVTISEISKRLDKGHHFSYSTIDKLPKVKLYLSTVTESVEDFQIRKLHWAYNNLVKLSSVISRSRLISTAGVAINLNSKNVIKEIDRILNL